MRYAVIKNNVVTNIIEATEETLASIPTAIDEDDVSLYVECQDDVKLRDGYVNDEFVIYKTVDEQLDELKSSYETLANSFNDKLTNLESIVTEIQEVLTDILLSGGTTDETSKS